MKNDRKIRSGQVRDWVNLDGETCVVLSHTDSYVTIRYLNSEEDEDNYTYPIQGFMEKTIVVM